MNIFATFAEPAKSKHPAFSYGFLAVILTLLAFDLYWRMTLPPFYPHDRNINLVVVLMLLFNHLAYQFRWPPAATAGLRLLAWGWLVFGAFYIYFSWRVH